MPCCIAFVVVDMIHQLAKLFSRWHRSNRRSHLQKGSFSKHEGKSTIKGMGFTVCVAMKATTSFAMFLRSLRGRTTSKAQRLLRGSAGRNEKFTILERRACGPCNCLFTRVRTSDDLAVQRVETSKLCLSRRCLHVRRCDTHVLVAASHTAIVDGVDASIAWMHPRTSWPYTVWWKPQPCWWGCLGMVATPRLQGKMHPLVRNPCYDPRNNRGGGSGSPTPACPGCMDPTRWHVVAVLWRRPNVCQSDLHVAVVLLHVEQDGVESACEIEQQARKSVVRVAVDRTHRFPSWGRGKGSILAAMDCC